jgi:hypothetical protein
MLSICLDSIHCNEETDEVGADEPYVLVTSVDLESSVSVAGFTVPLPAFEVVRYGFDDVDEGETHGTPGRSQSFWGPTGDPRNLSAPDAAIFVVGLMENDDGDPEALRGIVKGLVGSSVLGSLTDPRVITNGWLRVRPRSRRQRHRNGVQVLTPPHGPKPPRRAPPRRGSADQSLRSASFALSATPPTASLTLPDARSTLPSSLRSWSPVRSPAASFTRPLVSSIDPSDISCSSLSWCLHGLPRRGPAHKRPGAFVRTSTGSGVPVNLLSGH